MILYLEVLWQRQSYLQKGVTDGTTCEKESIFILIKD